MRRNGSFNNYWYSIDKSLLMSILLLAIIGTILISSAGTLIATRVGLSANYFINRHLVYLSISLFIIFLVSVLPEIYIRYFTVIGFAISLILLTTVLHSGTAIKGSYRWLYFFNISIQPSEFTKTFFASFNALLLSQHIKFKYLYSFITYLLLIILIMMEPDFGMSIMITMIFITQLFISNIKFIYIIFLALIIKLGAIIAYFTIPHIRYRVNNFLHPNTHGNFQVDKSLEAFRSGGFFGKGIGEGKITPTIPDSHTDFIFAVAGEECGALLCLFMISLFLFFAIKALYHLHTHCPIFQKITITGLVVQIICPALINIGVSLNLFPTKGMVLPFISYGGSSLIANSIAVGIILSFTKIKFSTQIR